MTKKELIEKLEQFKDDDEILAGPDRKGYFYDIGWLKYEKIAKGVINEESGKKCLILNIDCMKKLIIDRKFWYRNRGSLNSRLLREDGAMCCLGFLGKACGYTDSELLNIVSPEECLNKYGKNLWPKELIINLENFQYNSDLCYELMRINDCIGRSDTFTENQLIEKFKELDYELEFIN